MEDPRLDLFGKGSVWVLECWIDLPGVNNCSFSRGMEHLGDPGVTLHSHGCCSCFLRVALEKKAGKPSRILGVFFCCPLVPKPRGGTNTGGTANRIPEFLTGLGGKGT